MRKRKQNDFWSELGSIAVSGLVGYTVYRLLENKEISAQETSDSLEKTDNYDYKSMKRLLHNQSGLYVLNLDYNLLDRIERAINQNTDARVKIKLDRSTGQMILVERKIFVSQQNKRDAGNRILKDLFGAIKEKGKQVTLTFTKEENGTTVRRDNDAASNGSGSSVDIVYSFNKYSKAFYKNIQTGEIFTKPLLPHIDLMHEFKHATLAVLGTSFFIRNPFELSIKRFVILPPIMDIKKPISIDPEEALIIGKPLVLYVIKTNEDGNYYFTEVKPPANFGPTENQLYKEQGFNFRRMSHNEAY